MRDLQLFYYTRVIAKLPIETYQRVSKVYNAMQQSCPYASDTSKHCDYSNGSCTFQKELKDVEWIAWNEYNSPKSILIINESPDLLKLFNHSDNSKHRLVVLTENASTTKYCVADLLGLRVGDIFVPAETCVRICNMLWYIDINVVKGQGTASLMEELVTKLFEGEAAYAGPTLL